MKRLLLLCQFLTLQTSSQGRTTQEFDIGDGNTLSLVLEPSARVKRSDSVDVDVNDGAASLDLDFETQIQHDCNTIRSFDQDNIVMQDWVRNGRTFDGKKLKEFVKYNHAYGIPVLGIESFTEDSMKRACYLVRFLFAGNEQFRRTAYRMKMYLLGQKGGVCCPANVGNGGLSCPCLSTKPKTFNQTTSRFPLTQIYASAHEMAHFYIKYVFVPMEAEGLLKVPEFVNSTEWSWSKPEDMPCKFSENTLSPVMQFLYNSLQQDHLKGTSKIDRCKAHHYFIYTGQQKWLGLGFGNGQAKEESRTAFRETNPNLGNLVAEIWPCNNYYVSVCEDAAHDFTKGLAQQLVIGKSSEADITQMTCLPDVDTPELTDIAPLSPLPTEDVNLPGMENVFLKKCQKTIKKAFEKKDTKLETGEIAGYLGHSNEYAWWLRKCCAKTAKFV